MRTASTLAVLPDLVVRCCCRPTLGGLVDVDALLATLKGLPPLNATQPLAWLQLDTWSPHSFDLPVR